MTKHRMNLLYQRFAFTWPIAACVILTVATTAFLPHSAGPDNTSIEKAPIVQVAFAEGPTSDEKLLQQGKQIYLDSCADCHGGKGEGVEGSYEAPLIGDDTVGQLSDRITETMPEGSPEDCIGPDAQAVAAYIHHEFYSEAAQIRNRPPRIGIARLTAEQLRQSLSDLYASTANGLPWANPERGLKGTYFNNDRWRKEDIKLERIDPVLDFDFGRDAPVEGVDAKKFYIIWQGGLKVDVSGRYEIIVRSSCSFVMDFGRDGRDFINNHVQSGDKTEFRKALYLTAGRVYPIKLQMTQRNRKTELPPANISLSWVAPGAVEEIIPARHLIPDWIPPAFALQTNLPADDRSYGYERGIAVNPQWDDSTTSAALEFADIAIEELWPKFQRDTKKPSDRREKLSLFLARLIEKAFRGTLSDEQKKTYITNQLAATEDDSEAIKRSLLISLKSPYFLYPAASNLNAPTPRVVANRLGLTLYDSIAMDDGLIAIAKKESVTEDDVRNYAWGRFGDFRLRAKTRQLFYQWLNLGHISEITKSQKDFPGFDKVLVSDLKGSLDRTLDDVIDDESGDLRQLFQRHWAYTTPRLAKFYGDSWQPAETPEPPEKDAESTEPLTSADTATFDGFQKSVSDPDHRFGILTHPYLTSSLAYFDTTSPIHRGVFLIRFTMGRTLRPPAAAFSPLSPDLHPDLTTRQRVELQTSPESCQVCHTKINGLGFALENYDAVGRFRTTELGKPIDAKGQYTDREGQLIEFNGAGELAEYIVSSPDTLRAFVDRAFQHFVKQPVAAYGPGTLDRLTTKFRDSDYNVRALLVEIAVISAMQPQG